MRLTNSLLCALVVVIGACVVLAIGREKQTLRKLHDQQLATEALGLVLGQTRAEQRRYFEALGLALGLARNQKSKFVAGNRGPVGRSRRF